MAFQTPVLDKTFMCPSNDSTALPANRIAVYDATNAGVKLSTTAKASKFIGISNEDADTREGVSLRVAGIAQITAGGSITRGDYITNDTSGKAVSVTLLNTGALTQVVGIALNTVSSGELVDVLLQPFLGLS